MIKENRSLERGLIVLEALARHRSMSLAEIHRETGLPKSTLRRLLATLASRRFVRRSLSDNLYRVSVTLPDISIKPIPPGLALVADIGLTHALDLTKKIGWPSDIHVWEKQWMRVVESTRSASPFSIYRGQVDKRISLFGSATGLVCLSQMNEALVRELFDNETIELRFRPMRFGITWEKLRELLAETRSLGYGARIPNYYGETVIDDKLSAIALPLKKNGNLIGAVSVLWPRMFMPVDEFARLHLSDLSEAISKIEEDLDAFGQKRQKLGQVNHSSS